MSDVHFIKRVLRDMVEDIRDSITNEEYLNLLEKVQNLTEDSFGSELVALINNIGDYRYQR